MLYLMVLILLLQFLDPYFMQVQGKGGAAMTTLIEERNRAFADRFPLHLDDVRFQRDPVLYGFGPRKTAGAVTASGFRLRSFLMRAVVHLFRFLYPVRSDPA
jgi:hypothetical protein